MEPASQLGLKSVVSGLTQVLQLSVGVDETELRKWKESLRYLLCSVKARVGGRNCGLRVHRLGQQGTQRKILWIQKVLAVIVAPKVSGMLSNVCQVKNQIGRQFPLHFDAPVLDHRWPAVRRSYVRLRAAVLIIDLRGIKIRQSRPWSRKCRVYRIGRG